VTSSFKQQVLTLMSKINQTAPQFVRCIKPNMDKRDSFFDSTVAERQIVTGGIVDAVSIVQQGFPHRRLCNHFATEYSHLVPALRSADYAAALAAKKPSISVSDALKTHTSIFRKRSSINGDGASSSASPRSDRIPDTERCLIILQHLRISQDRFAVGHTLLFLKSGVVGLLEDESNRQRYYYQVLISKNVMRFLVLTRYKAIRRALMLIQCAYRCSRARVTLRLRRKIVVQALQKYIRRCLCRVAYVKSYAARSLDAACRRSRDRRSYHAQLNQIYHKSKVPTRLELPSVSFPLLIAL
jgi:myosin-5